MPPTTETARVPEEITGRQRRTPVGKISFRQTFRALRHRNYRLFFYGQLVSLIGTWMQQTAMSWLVYQITGSKLLLGVVAAVGSAPMMVFSLWGGAIADRYPKRRIIICTQVAQMLPAFFLAGLAWFGLATPWLIVLVATVTGIGMAFDMPARQAFTVEMTSREDLLNAISLNSSIFNGARVIGPSLAGLVIGSLGTPVCFLINGLSFIAVIIGLRMMRLPDFVPPAARRWESTERLERSRLRLGTSPCPDHSCPSRNGRDFWLVLCGAPARLSRAMFSDAAPTVTACSCRRAELARWWGH